MGNTCATNPNDLKFDENTINDTLRWLEETDDERVVNFYKYPFPDEAPVDYSVIDQETNKVLRFSTYRYPAHFHANSGKKPKGILFYQTGFYDYTGRHGHMCRMFSEMGYDCFGFDTRGHGKSQGDPARINSIKECADDQKGFQRAVLEKFYPDVAERPPVFLFAHSMACMISINLLT